MLPPSWSLLPNTMPQPQHMPCRLSPLPTSAAGVPDGTGKLAKLGLVPFSDALEEVDMELPAFGGARSIAGQYLQLVVISARAAWAWVYQPPGRVRCGLLRGGSAAAGRTAWWCTTNQPRQRCACPTLPSLQYRTPPP